MEQLVRKVIMPHGVYLDTDEEGKRTMRGAIDAVKPYVHTFIEPLEGKESVEVRVATLADVLTYNKIASNEYVQGTKQFKRHLIRAALKDRTTPNLTDADLDNMAGVDYDDLSTVVNTGRNPKTGNPAYNLSDDADTEQRALLRLHKLDDRDFAEQRLENGRDDDPVRYEAYLTWMTVFIGDPADHNFSKSARVPFTDFLTITWPDFQALASEVYSRDYKPITAVLDGTVTTPEGKEITFQSIPGTEVEEAEGSL